MIRSITISLLFLLLFKVGSVYGQIFAMPENADEFGIKVIENIALVSTESSETIGKDFEKLWRDFGQDLRTKIIKNSQLMIEKGYGTKAYFIPYLQNIVLALNHEKMEDVQFLDFLNVTDRVVENESPELLINYFSTVKTFFEHRALFYSVSSKLLITNDTYSFEYFGGNSGDSFMDRLEADYDEDEEEPYAEEDDYDDEYYEDEDYEEDQDDDYYEDDYDYDYDDNYVLGDEIEYFPDPPPLMEGPVITFHNADLEVNSTRKVSDIKNTKGSFLINTNIFSGENGTIDWTTGGLGDSVYISLNQYNFNVRKPEFSASAVKLTIPEINSNPIEGEMSYDGRKGESGIRFTSYKYDIIYKNIADLGMSFKGGLSLIGSKKLSASKQPRTSVFNVDENGVKKFSAKGYIFEFGDSLVSSTSSSVTIYHRMDSIYHPSASIRYNTKSRELVIKTDDGDYKYAPFYSSYTNMDITADMIRWDLDSDSLEISILSGRSELPVIFQSEEYYNADVLNNMAKNYDFNPLMLAVNYVRITRERKFYPSDISGHYELNTKEVANALKELAQWGYINYDKSTRVYSLKKKARHYFLSKRGRSDFDNLLILSNMTSGANVTFDMKNEEMHINGIEKFYISEILDVYIVPDNSTITLGEDRNFTFNGRLFAGNFEYVGNDFQFRYDSFLVNMNQIEKIQFYIQNEGESRKKKVENVIAGITEADSLFDVGLDEFEGTSGVLYVNRPDNKSGRKMFPNFPKFEGGGSGSVVFFSGSEYLDGIYNKSLYFVLPPFNLDSLSDSDPAAINFDGTFYSRGTFPEFQEKLHIMPDQSLGFDHSIPPTGYKLFEGDGTIYNRVTLNRQGLVGSGRLDYLTSTMESENYRFYPDSMAADATGFRMREELFGDIIFPQMSVDNFHMLWLPAKDSMYIQNNPEELIGLYNGIASLNGIATISHGGVYGKGNLFSLGTETVSDEFNFQYDRIRARHANYIVSSSNPEKPALTGTDVRLNFDLTLNQAEINPEIEGTAALEFPYAQFKTSIPSAVWDLAENKVTMTKPENVDIKYSYFYTTREDLDSLAFNAEQAEYDINTQELKVSGIPFIKVADALITPENGEVLILENARIGTLTNTTLVIDTLYGYHNLYNGTIDVISRNEFSGSATYRLVNAVADTFAIELTDFRLEPLETKGKRSSGGLQTVANGEVGEEDGLLISPGMYFRGDIIMKAQQPALELEGFVKLDLKKIPDYDTWITYSNTAGQQEVIFNFDESLTEFGQNLTAGLHFDYNDYSLYSTFIYNKKDPLDEDFFVPSGILSFKPDSGEYVIINQDKSLGLTYEGKSFVYKEATSDISFEGPVHMIENSKDISILAAVIGSGNLQSTNFDFNTLMTLDFNVPAAIYVMMASDFLEAIDLIGPPEAVEDRTKLIYNLANLIGDKVAKAYETKSMEEYTPLGTMSPILTKPFVFSEVNLKWSDDQKSFYNDNGVMGLSHVLRNDINASFESFFEIVKGIDGDKISLFIKAAPEIWYYFGYDADKLLIYSSNSEVNDFLVHKTNQGKAKIGEMVFGLGDRGETLDFINTFRKIYYGIEEPYDLEGDPALEEEKKEKVTDDDDDGF